MTFEEFITGCFVDVLDVVGDKLPPLLIESKVSRHKQNLTVHLRFTPPPRRRTESFLVDGVRHKIRDGVRLISGCQRVSLVRRGHMWHLAATAYGRKEVNRAVVGGHE